MKIKVNKNKEVVDEDVGILYVVYFRLDEKDLVKIGVTSRTVEDRVSEILVSIFKKYREFPYCRPKRFRKTSDVYEKEALMHQYFKDRNYKPEKVFSGSTEFFEVPLDEVVHVYENLLEGRALDEGL
jgi:hypothetical protein